MMIRLYGLLFMLATLLSAWLGVKYGVSDGVMQVYLDPEGISFYVNGDAEKIFKLSLILHGTIYLIALLYVFLLVSFFVLLNGKRVVMPDNLLDMVSNPMSFIFGFLFFSLFIADASILLSPVLSSESGYTYLHLIVSFFLLLFVSWSMYRHNFISTLSFFLLRVVFRQEISITNFKEVIK